MKKLKACTIFRDDVPKHIGTIAKRISNTWDSNHLVLQDKTNIIPGHGDLRLGNLLFDKFRSPVGIVDFDTLGLHSWGDEVGDTLRSIATACGNSSTEMPVIATHIGSFLKNYFASSRTLQPVGGDAASAILSMVRIQLNLSARFCLSALEYAPFNLSAPNLDAHRHLASGLAETALLRAERWLTRREELTDRVSDNP